MLSAFDLDHTLLKKNSSVAFFLYLTRKKIISRLSCLYCLLYYMQHSYCGLSLKQLHEKIFFRFLQGRKLSEIMVHVAPFWDECGERLIYFPSWSILKKRQHLGAHTLIASASPDFLVQEIAKRWGVDACIASTYAIDKEGCFCQITVVEGEDKAEFVQKMCTKWALPLETSEAYSDSHLDLPFLYSVGIRVVVNPDRILRKLAQENGWENI